MKFVIKSTGEDNVTWYRSSTGKHDNWTTDLQKAYLFERETTVRKAWWLRSSVRYIVLPDFPITLVADDSGHDIDIVVRANRWGIVHAPLTKWLVVNDIEYYEY